MPIRQEYLAEQILDQLLELIDKDACRRIDSRRNSRYEAIHRLQPFKPKCEGRDKIHDYLIGKFGDEALVPDDMTGDLCVNTAYLKTLGPQVFLDEIDKQMARPIGEIYNPMRALFEHYEPKINAQPRWRLLEDEGKLRVELLLPRNVWNAQAVFSDMGRNINKLFANPEIARVYTFRAPMDPSKANPRDTNQLALSIDANFFLKAEHRAKFQEFVKNPPPTLLDVPDFVPHAMRGRDEGWGL